MSGAIYRDILYLIFKHVENKYIGVKIMQPIATKHIKRHIIAFVENTDFYATGENSEEDIQNMMNICIRLHKATG